jgi:hypothetical protein
LIAGTADIAPYSSSTSGTGTCQQCERIQTLVDGDSLKLNPIVTSNCPQTEVSNGSFCVTDPQPTEPNPSVVTTGNYCQMLITTETATEGETAACSSNDDCETW